MNNLGNATFTDHRGSRGGCLGWFNCEYIPSVAIYILIALFLIGLGISIFILAVVHNALFFLIHLALSALVAALLLWNSVNWTRNGSLLRYLHSIPDSDLRFARDGDLVKITGVVACGSVSLQSSYEKVDRCVYTSTLLYEFGNLGLKPADVEGSCFQWRLAYSERFSTDFDITDNKSGMRALVKAGPGCKVVPLVLESRLVNTSKNHNMLSSSLTKWLRDRNLPTEIRLLRLEEGYIKESSHVSVIGMLHRNGEVMMIVQPPEVISTGCLWQKLLLPVDIDGLVLWLPKNTDTSPANNPNTMHRQLQLSYS